MSNLIGSFQNGPLAFYQKALGAVVRFCMPDENGGVMQIGDSVRRETANPGIEQASV